MVATEVESELLALQSIANSMAAMKNSKTSENKHLDAIMSDGAHDREPELGEVVALAKMLKKRSNFGVRVNSASPQRDGRYDSPDRAKLTSQQRQAALAKIYEGRFNFRRGFARPESGRVSGTRLLARGGPSVSTIQGPALADVTVSTSPKDFRRLIGEHVMIRPMSTANKLGYRFKPDLSGVTARERRGSTINSQKSIAEALHYPLGRKLSSAHSKADRRRRAAAQYSIYSSSSVLKVSSQRAIGRLR